MLEDGGATSSSPLPLEHAPSGRSNAMRRKRGLTLGDKGDFVVLRGGDERRKQSPTIGNNTVKIKN